MLFRRRVQPKPVFTYGERVRILNGFYREQVGTIVAELGYHREYRVALDTIGQIWFAASDLARLADEDQPPHIRKIIVETETQHVRA